MLLTLFRTSESNSATMGRLEADGRYLCDTLEPPYGYASGPRYIGGRNTLSPKDSSKGRIPEGFYRVRLTWSPKFKRLLPLLDDVIGFSGIRIHSGNSPKDTKGCLLLGRRLAAEERLQDSRRTVDSLVAQLLALPSNEPVYLEIGSPSYLSAARSSRMMPD